VLKWQQSYGASPAWINDPSQNTYIGCSFSQPDPTAAPVRTITSPYWYGDAVLMKEIAAGFPVNTQGSYVVGKAYVELDDSDIANVHWRFNKTSSASPDIVKGFCSCGQGPGRSSCLAGY
jgi:hypothetical protein